MVFLLNVAFDDQPDKGQHRNTGQYLVNRNLYSIML